MNPSFGTLDGNDTSFEAQQTEHSDQRQSGSGSSPNEDEDKDEDEAEAEADQAWNDDIYIMEDTVEAQSGPPCGLQEHDSTSPFFNNFPGYTTATFTGSYATPTAQPRERTASNSKRPRIGPNPEIPQANQMLLPSLHYDSGVDLSTLPQYSTFNSSNGATISDEGIYCCQCNTGPFPSATRDFQYPGSCTGNGYSTCNHIFCDDCFRNGARKRARSATNQQSWYPGSHTTCI